MAGWVLPGWMSVWTMGSTSLELTCWRNQSKKRENPSGAGSFSRRRFLCLISWGGRIKPVGGWLINLNAFQGKASGWRESWHRTDIKGKCQILAMIGFLLKFFPSNLKRRINLGNMQAFNSAWNVQPEEPNYNAHGCCVNHWYKSLTWLNSHHINTKTLGTKFRWLWILT